MKKRFLAAGLVLAMGVSLLTGCGGGNGGSSGGSSGSSGGGYDKVVMAFSTFNNIPAEEDLAVVEEEINKITREKINVEVKLKPIGIADYSSSVSRSLQAGEQIDIFHTLGDFNNCVATGMTADITEYVGTTLADTAQYISEEWYASTTKDGKVYGVPVMKPVALTSMIIYNADIAAQAGVDMSNVNSLDDLTPILEQVKANCPDVIPMAPVQTGVLGTTLSIEGVDYLSDDFYTPVGVLFGDNMTVTDFYSSAEFKKICDFARNLYQNDLVMKDAATTTSMAAELMSSGNYFCYIASYSYPEEDTAASLGAQCNMNAGAKQIANAYLSTGDLNALTYCVSSTSKVPEAATKFLNLCMTDEEVINLIIYGIKDRDYVLDADGFMSYPEGQDAATVPYTAQLSCGTFGNFFLMYPMVGTSKESLDWELEQNKTAKTSPAMGFSFDSSALQSEYTAVKNVINQYLPGLQCGSADPDTDIQKFVDALNAAGYDRILAAKQEQLDEWIAGK